MSKFRLISLPCITLPLAILVSACSTMPSGPSVMVLPGSGQSFDQFRADDAVCRQFATFQVGGVSADDAAVSSGVGSAVIGTAIGAAAGAAIGGGGGAAIGAGTGLVAGSLVGTSNASSSWITNQQRYDTGYIQCMYAKGHQVPVTGQFSNVIPRQTTAPAANIPPPPAGLPPPPPSPN